MIAGGLLPMPDNAPATAMSNDVAAFSGHNVVAPIYLSPAEAERLSGPGPSRPSRALIRAVRRHYKAAKRRASFTHKLTRKAAKNEITI